MNENNRVYVTCNVTGASEMFNNLEEYREFNRGYGITEENIERLINNKERDTKIEILEDKETSIWY